jgi:hypothetical protein
MKRSALIIGAPDEVIPGVKQDMLNYQAFLKSPLGGAWRPDEITTWQSPSAATVRSRIDALKTAVDYALIVFCGHGAHVDGQSIAQVNSRETLRVSELKVGAPKQTLIVDCCRVHEAGVALEERLVKAAMDSKLDPLACRRLFDERLTQCAPGLVTLFACSVGEGAGESADGGYYSSALLRAARTFEGGKLIDVLPNRQSRILSVSEAHALARDKVSSDSGGRQSPTSEYPRTTPHFPWAVVT